MRWFRHTKVTCRMEGDSPPCPHLGKLRKDENGDWVGVCQCKKLTFSNFRYYPFCDGCDE